MSHVSSHLSSSFVCNSPPRTRYHPSKTRSGANVTLSKYACRYRKCRQNSLLRARPARNNTSYHPPNSLVIARMGLEIPSLSREWRSKNPSWRYQKPHFSTVPGPKNPISAPCQAQKPYFRAPQIRLPNPAPTSSKKLHFVKRRNDAHRVFPLAGREPQATLNFTTHRIHPRRLT